MKVAVNIFLNDSEVGSEFGISSSKMRTAQRYGLIESQIDLSDSSRYIRAWRADMVGYAYVALLLSEHFLIPFQVAVESLVACLKVYTGPDVRDLILTGGSLGPGGGVGFIPMVRLVDHRVLSLCWKDRNHSVGQIGSGPDGRHQFYPDSPGEPAEPLSVAYFDLVVAFRRFSERMHAVA